MRRAAKCCFRARLSRPNLASSVGVFLLFAFVVGASAAQQAWVAKYASGPGSAVPPAAIGLDKDGNVYVVGSSTRSTAPYDLDYVVIKYSALGVGLWTNR